MREVPVGFLVNRIPVSGILHLPSGSRPAPAVVMCHGFTGSKTEAHFIFVKTARTLANSGIAAFRFDFRGSGDSGGRFEDMTVPGEIADARQAVAFTAGQPRIDSRRIGLLGLSLGGLVAANTASVEPRIRSLALWCPVGSLAWTLKRLKSWNGSKRREGKIRDVGGLGLGPGFFRNPEKSSPVAALQKCRHPFPVLVLKGGADTVIPMKENGLYLRGLRYSTHPVRQIILPGAGHTFERLDHEREAIRLTTNWYLETL